MKKNQDFMQRLFILITISKEEHKIEKTSEHSSEEDARSSMIAEKMGYYIIIRVSSNGAPEDTSGIPSYKTPSDGHAEGKVIHTDEGLSGIANHILMCIMDSYGREVKNAANKLRRTANLASEKKACA